MIWEIIDNVWVMDMHFLWMILYDYDGLVWNWDHTFVCVLSIDAYVVTETP